MFLTKLAALLNKRKVKYVLVGGYAVAMHGVLRGTIDIDILTRLDLKSLTELEKCLNELGLVSKIPVSAKDMIQFRSEYMSKKNLIAWSFCNPKDPTQLVDVLINADISDFKMIQMKIDGVSIPVIGLNDLIKMKTASGRDQDLADVIALKEIRDTK